MKLTVYNKSNSHPALTYKGKRVITVCPRRQHVPQQDIEQRAQPLITN